MFHKHQWKEIERTYAPPLDINEITGAPREEIERMVFGFITILWECQNENCKKLRKEEMIGKPIISSQKYD
jgi:hypothetical protein